MLHYLIMIFEKNYPDTLHIQEDLSCVPEAAKVKSVPAGWGEGGGGGGGGALILYLVLGIPLKKG